MIVVRIELWPRGDADRKRDLATVAIANVGGNTETGSYDFVISHQAGTKYAKSTDPIELLQKPSLGWRSGHIDGFKRQLGAVQLVKSVLQVAFAFSPRTKVKP